MAPDAAVRAIFGQLNDDGRSTGPLLIDWQSSFRRRRTTTGVIYSFVVVSVLACLGTIRTSVASIQFDRPYRDSASSTEADAGAVPQAATPKVDYVIDNIRSHSAGAAKRTLELDAKPYLLRSDGSSPTGGDSWERRLVVPLQLQDAHFLRLLSLEHLRVDLVPHRTPEPHVQVSILTDALSIYNPVDSAQHRRRLSRWFSAPSGGRWLTIMQSVVHFPVGVSLVSCEWEWKWADFNETEAIWRETRPPFRVLEIACPRQPKGFLLLPHTPTSGRLASRDIVASFFRVAFMAMLIVVFVAQVVLLICCITMLVVQMGMQRRPQT
eukprot:TRINITY_DN53797_c0_g1_i1.p1 TRINITY_DN53797_c0_g1~~TRINITY_DN53797_c0_g1_i1.p1  ORF type:complete len:324 (+),score=26.71 TRINITY_DN53797_c0_g1_i1:44-1015(+)